LIIWFLVVKKNQNAPSRVRTNQPRTGSVPSPKDEVDLGSGESYETDSNESPSEETGSDFSGEDSEVSDNNSESEFASDDVSFSST